jgi:hypothetical protein
MRPPNANFLVTRSSFRLLSSWADLPDYGYSERRPYKKAPAKISDVLDSENTLVFRSSIWQPNV